MKFTESDEEDAPPQPLRQAPPGLRNEDLPALFWDDLPEEDNESADAAAIKAIMAESTPEEQAEGFKNMGNDALKAGMRHKKKFYLRQAIDQYDKGLDVQCSDAGVNSILCANRAHVNLLLGNFRNAYHDGLAALRHNDQNIKAYYRAAKGAMGLRKYDRCMELCSAGLAVEAGNKDLVDIKRRAAVEKDAQAQRDAAEELRQAKIRSPARVLAEAVLSRGWRVGRPQFTIGDRRPSLDEDGLVHWPVLFFYPEAGMQQDTVDDVCEEDRLGDHLDLMFGPEAPPLEWDSRGEYSRENVELYYLSHAATPLDLDQLTEVYFGSWPDVAEEGPRRYGPQAAGWVRVRDGWTLRDALARPDHTMPGVPTFFVVANGTDFRERFLEGDIPLL
ncbi:tetratricopeptide repeat 4-like protein [Micractinium conductrix]|uniref:Tetratricopeptide repeat 4-like protein n=1 Tax=Micractinium conductrix TaxID=554055 RepID=A0A2P6VDW0_9CHLO|nr:tetratricopeptide repeat 4-like protein [Micractinium conductrix]|eukprot:PSC72268.1 tetratricopeptide repeat 4-like protein [Micractinium conductrix]